MRVKNWHKRNPGAAKVHEIAKWSVSGNDGSPREWAPEGWDPFVQIRVKDTEGRWLWLTMTPEEAKALGGNLQAQAHHATPEDRTDSVREERASYGAKPKRKRGSRNRLTDMRCAWKKATIAQRTSFLYQLDLLRHLSPSTIDAIALRDDLGEPVREERAPYGGPIVERRIGRNRGKPRLWLEGECLIAAGWDCGTRFDAVFGEGVVTYTRNPKGARKVAGTRERPIIDTNTPKLAEALGAVIGDMTSVQLTHRRITVLHAKASDAHIVRDRTAPYGATAVDLFAGAGGFTTGARAAGVRVLWAANHWQQAVDIHAANHPQTTHACQDLHQADWTTVPAMDIVLASPACQGHSKARGKERAHHDATRSTAWAVVSCVEYHRPQAVVVENVKEFLGWALYPAWEQAMRALGYRLNPMIIDSADAGVPQHRERLFILCGLERDLDVAQPSEAHRPVSEVIEWETGSWSPVRKPKGSGRPRAQATIDRWRAGRAECGERFVMPYYGNGSGKTGRSLDRPIGTVTTRDRWALVDGDRMRMLTPAEYRAIMGFPDTYQLPRVRKTAIHMLGNAVCPPVAEYLCREIAKEVR